MNKNSSFIKNNESVFVKDAKLTINMINSIINNEIPLADNRLSRKIEYRDIKNLNEINNFIKTLKI